MSYTCFLTLTKQGCSNLMRTMASKVKGKWHDGSPILPTEAFVGIGDLTFDQLSNLRHRGAFSTVALTFTRCCQLAPQYSLDQSPVQDIIKTWYKVGISSNLEVHTLICSGRNELYLRTSFNNKTVSRYSGTDYRNSFFQCSANLV